MTSAPESLEAAAEELYALPPKDFTARREELAKAARSAGDGDLAKAVKDLRRPTVSAWLLNLLVREDVSELSGLLDVGEQLREAQSQLAGTRMKELTTQRQTLEGKLLRRVRTVAAQEGQAATPAVLVEVEATLRAAMADPRAADAVASGRLTRALSYAGLGEVDVTEATATPPAERRPKPSPGPAPEPKREPEPEPEPTREPKPDEDELTARREAKVVAEREAAVADARQRAEEAEVRLASAQDAEQALRDRVNDLQRQLKEARDALSDATHEAASAQRESDRARRALATAERELARARG